MIKPSIYSLKLFTTKQSLLGIFFGLLILILSPAIFGDLSIDIEFLVTSFVILSFSILYYSYFFSKIRVKNFLVVIFTISLIVRILAVFYYYHIFFQVTGTPFEVTFADSLYYDERGKIFAESIRNNSFNFLSFIDLHSHPDKVGYQTFLGFIYLITGDSIIIARLIQAIISAYTVIIAYKIATEIWTEFHGRSVAILFSGFPPFILYSSLHLREFLLIFFTLLMTYHFLKVVKYFELKSLVILIFLLVLMLFFRTIYVLVFILSMILFITFFRINSFKNIIQILTIFICLFLILSIFPVFDASWIKILGYIGLEEKAGLGGYSQELLVSRGMGLAQFIGGPIFILPSFTFPMPSLLKLTIESFGQSMHWYFTGGLILWTFFSLFYFKGIFESFRRKNELAIFLIILIILHSVALLESFYFTSIRYNQVKMALLLLFIPQGMIHLRCKPKTYTIYLLGMTLIILIYNYLRIFGRMMD